MRIMAVIAIWLLLSSQFCFAEGLDTLIDVARSQGDIQKEYSEETRNFEQVKKGVDSGMIQKGQSKDEIVRRYGEPVVALQDSLTGREKWVYKPAKSDFFKGIKIYLFFDKADKLCEIAVEGAGSGKGEEGKS